MSAIGIQVGGAPVDPRLALDSIRAAEAAGVGTVWLTQAAGGGDALSVLAAAAETTSAIELGVAVLPATARHPLVAASQAATVARLSGGRLRLGLGASHRHLSEVVYGIPFERPQARLREYVEIVRALLHDGAVDVDGEHWSAHAHAEPCAVPLLLGALGPRGFELAGELSDGAIPWLCPSRYLHEVGRPALAAGAARADRDPPALLEHVLVAMAADRGAALPAAIERIAPNARMPYYARMLERAGFAVSEAGGVERAADALLVSGEPAAVAEGLRARLAAGSDELLVTPVAVDDPAAELDALFAVVGSLA